MITRTQLIKAIIARLRENTNGFQVIPVANLSDGFRLQRGHAMKRKIGVHFSGGGSGAAPGQVGQRTEVVGGVNYNWFVGIYNYHISPNVNDRITGTQIGDGLLSEIDTIEPYIRNYRFDTELPGQVCDARIVSDYATQSYGVKTADGTIYYAAWCGFQVRYMLEKR